MIITKDNVVTIQYTLRDESGSVIEASKKDGLSYIHGTGILVPGLERELENKKAGDAFKIKIEPKDGYGEYDSSKVFSVSKEKFSEHEKFDVGMKFRVNTQQGEKVIIIKKVNEDRVTVDINHPFAGKTLYYDGKIMDVNDKTRKK